MSKLFRNDSPGALTLEEACTLEIKRAADRRLKRQAEQLAAAGRGSDTEIAHVARGELVLPVQLQNDDVLNAIQHWDYKQSDRKYQDFGNVHYGAVGKAFGLPDWVLKMEAGRAQKRDGNTDPKFGTWWKGPPYGDDPHDQEMIQQGIDYYKRGGRGY